MIDTGNVALSLLSTPCFGVINKKFSSATGLNETESMAWLAYLVAMHDIGKCNENFQMFNEDLARDLITSGMPFPPEPDRKYRHEKGSREWIRTELAKEGWGRRPCNTIANSILSHHSRNTGDDIYEFPAIRAQWDKYAEILEEEVKKVFKPPHIAYTDFSDNSEAGILLSGLIVLSDWIASNVDLMQFNDMECPTGEYVSISMENAKKAVAYLGFDESVPWQGKSEFSAVWAGSTFKELRPIQQKCVDIIQSGKIPNLVIIEAPMGEGKTEAAIYTAVQMLQANGLSGMYIALPTAATSNQMYIRVNEFLAMHTKNSAIKARLVHGMSWLIDDIAPMKELHSDDKSDNTSEMPDWFKPSKRALLAPYSVGTIDQSLMSVLNVKFGFLRLFGLSNKVLIIDEVHAYDAYMNTILRLLLNWCSCLKIPVIMLSATLPSGKKRELLASFQNKEDIPEFKPAIDYPLITYIDQHNNVIEEPVVGSSKRMEIEVDKHSGFMEDPDRIASLAIEASKNGGCICVILNTVKAAQDVYRSIKSLNGDGIDILLFHSRFRACRRDEIEKKALEMFDKRSLLPEKDPGHTIRPKRAILVATQVVEQSLDLDFDEMITEIAPIDLILQRSGRLHRHDRKDRPTGKVPKLHVLLPGSGKPDFGPSEYIYDRYILLRTLDIILSINHISIPSDIRGLVEKAYTPYKPDMIPTSSDITIDDLASSYSNMIKEDEGEKSKSTPYQIPNPNKKEYSPASASYPFSYDEDDNGTRSYFYAKTRSGDNTRRVIILNDGEFEDILTRTATPAKEDLRRIMLRMVNIPCGWIDGCIPEPDYMPILPGPKWIKGICIIRIKSWTWKGVDNKGNHIVIKNDDEFGLTYENEKDEVNI